MGKFAHITTRLGVAAAATVMAFSMQGSAEAAKHPRLVSVDASKCSMCHAKLMRGAKVVHAPVEDDCTSCHEVSVTKEGTTVDLSAPEPDLCVMCHDGLEAAAAGDLETAHAPVTDSCLTCHQAHAGEQEALLTMPKTELCAECHDTADLKEAHGGQITKSINCTSCHSAHGSANEKLLMGSIKHAPFADGTCDVCHRAPFAGRIRLQARGEKVCISCHGDLREEAGELGSIHAALDGTRTRAGCLSCHDPHMSPNSTLLTASGTALCSQCHSSVVEAASVDTGHAPAAEDCSTCHQPHTSENASLLTDSTPDLCLMCHDPDDENLRAIHLGAVMKELDCISCHSPHGAGYEKLLAENVHVVLAEGCDTCHEGAVDRLKDGGESSLCLSCHTDIGEFAAEAEVFHAAMEMVRCVECHNPHASPQERLVRAPSGGECTGCHDDQAAGPDEVAHGVITLLGCRACHEPHGSATDNFLRVAGSELCLECHDSARVKTASSGAVSWLRKFEVSPEVAAGVAVLELSENGEHGHPMRNHRVLGTPTEEELARTEVTSSGDLSCLSCHDPHKGKSRHLFAGGVGSPYEMCGICHQK
ncbi:MAG: cytochrome c3 family protein [Thermoanaerobaculales bacterium]|nr:cytochrome c3 family protein [Thermoanaerobaculales bacterium]